MHPGYAFGSMRDTSVTDCNSTSQGVSVHPGYAFGSMVNAGAIAAQFAALVHAGSEADPSGLGTPRTTQLRQVGGFGVGSWRLGLEDWMLECGVWGVGCGV